MDAHAAALTVTSAVEASANPQAWSEVAVLAARAMHADSASIVFLSSEGHSAVRCCPRTDPDLHRRYDAAMHATNYLWAKVTRMPAGSAVSEATLGGRERYLSSTIYNEFIRPQGMDSVVLLTITEPSAPLLGVLTIGRRTGSAHFVGEDLRDAAAIATALARTVAATGASLRLASRDDARTLELLVTPEGRLLSRHAGIAEFARAGILALRGGHLRVDLLPGLEAAIAEAGRDPRHWPPPVGAVLGPVTTGLGRFRFAVSPGGLSAPGAVRVTISAASLTDPLSEFARRHGLTPREATIAGHLGRGMTLPEVARQLGISLTTARTHLGRLFDKTDTRSQLALALRVAGEVARRTRDPEDFGH